jgi:phenylalanyl-tRNA synthetase beta chain
MNVSYRWLKELAPTIDEPAAALAERITYTAVPVDEVIWLGEGLTELVVGRVMSIAKHPQADRLVICQVDIGQGEPVQVVTGAPVVVEGGFYPFVGAGQALPDGQAVKRVKLRGEYSEGMLCSERELGVGRDAAGIMQLRGDFTPGQPVIEVLGCDDYRLVLDVTANRPDLLGHLGIAREVAPGGEVDLRLPEFPGHRRAEYTIERANEEGSAGGVRVRIEDPEGCPRYMGAVIRGVTVGPSPEWLASRLRAVGLQPINNVVDATNYVLYELNQPLHAFDLSKLGGPAVVIRRAREGESLCTLDGKDRSLDPEMLVIADAGVPTAMAGLMGGEASEVTEDTRDVFLECAYFGAKRIRQGARRLGLETDASYRFRRGIDQAGLPRALKRVIELILSVAGGGLEGNVIDVFPRPAPAAVLELRPSRVSQLLGVELSQETIRGCLEPIGYEVSESKGDRLVVAAPSWRPDVQGEVDLIEEVARRHGYGEFPDEMGTFRPTSVPEDEYVAVSARLRELMVGLGFLEAKTSSFAPAVEGEVHLLNPLSEREDHLRKDLLTGLVHRVEYNFARGQRDIRLFELGTVFRSADGPTPEERIRVAAVWTGRRAPLHWSGPSADWDFWDLKGILASMAGIAAPIAEIRALGGDEDATPMSLEEPLLVVDPDGARLGWAGRLPASALEAPRWAGSVWGCELEVLPAIVQPQVYQPLPVYPGVERDLALIVPRGIATAEVGAVIREVSPDHLEHLTVFDVYEGEKVPEGTRSIAWRLRFRSPDRTLTDDEIEVAMSRIISALEERLNVELRGT